jgi:regulator of sigma E protease
MDGWLPPPLETDLGDRMTIFATVVVLGVLIFVHELGHFLAAKSVGIEVQRFSIGLGPTIFGFRRGETEYVISWIPLGGYVKMGGMDDEVMERLEGGAEEGADAAGVNEPRQPKPSDLDGKPIWARTLVISAGVIMNMLFAFAVYTGVNAAWGLQELAETRIGRVQPGLLPPGADALAELPAGARLITVGERQVENWGDVRDGILEAPVGPLRIITEDPGVEIEIDVTSDPHERTQVFRGLSIWMNAELGIVNPGSPAESGGLETGDQVLVAGGIPMTSWYDFVDVVEARPGIRTELSLERDGRPLTRYVTPEAVTEDDPVTGESRRVGRVGIYPAPEFVYRDVSLTQAVQLGYAETVGVSRMILGFLGDLVTGGVSPRSVGSILTIGAASGQAAQLGIETFLRFMALFSVNLAILNLLPIPVLDGGHLVFLGIEAVRGKALSLEQRMRWSHVGFLVIMGIMLWALSNDILRLFGI